MSCRRETKCFGPRIDELQRLAFGEHRPHFLDPHARQVGKLFLDQRPRRRHFARVVEAALDRPPVARRNVSTKAVAFAPKSM